MAPSRVAFAEDTGAELPFCVSRLPKYGLFLHALYSSYGMAL
jgi:hypothetical protein